MERAATRPAPLPIPWRRVAWSMAAGAFYDLAFAAAILAAPATASRLLGIPLPDDLVYLRLNGVFLALLAALYVLAFLDPVRYRGIVGVAAAGRLAGAVFLAAAWLSGRPPAFAGLALGDLAFAVAHAGLLLAAGRVSTPSR